MAQTFETTVGCSNVTETFLDMMFALAEAPLNQATDHQVRRCYLDFAGCAVGGSTHLERLAPVAASFGGGDALVLGTDKTMSAAGAAFTNGLFSHVMELDDGHRRAMQHLGAPVFSALIAALDTPEAQAAADWGTFAKAAVCGYEVAVALGEALQPNHKLQGFHATGTCGTVGAAAAVCVLRGYNRATAKRALAAAATSAAGLLEVIGEGSALKPYNVAHACSAALVACAMAQAGYDGPKDVLGGKRGLLRNFGASRATVRFDLDDLRIHQIYTKPYADCRHCHSPNECAEIIAAANTIDPADVASVLVETYDLAVFGHDQKQVENPAEAKMSIPFGIASVLCGRGAYMDAFTPQAVEDPAICQLMTKVTVVADEAMTAACPDKRGARVTVTVTDGTQYAATIEYPKGEPENAMTDQDMTAKALGLLLAGGFEQEKAQQAVACVWNTESLLQQMMAAFCKE